MTSAVVTQSRYYLAVDLLAVLSMVGKILRWLSLTLLAPTAVALIYGETVMPFVVTLVIGFVAGYGLEYACGRRSDDVTVREAFAVVALTWAGAALLGGIPYMVEGGDLGNLVNAYFETMSGFTTTGSTVIGDFESHNNSIFFWRALTQWLGGMGIVVLAIAIFGRTGPGGKALLEREAPGPEVDKLTPRLRDTALHLWLIYTGISVVMVLALWVVGLLGLGAGMNFFESVVHMFSAMSTGGFSPNADSMQPYGAVTLTIMTVFQVIAGANFVLWYLMVKRDWGAALRDGEFRIYLGILTCASILVGIGLLATTDKGLLASFGEATFQVVTIMTTTGYASQDFNTWAAFCLLVLFLMMFIGGCAGSTAGAIKVIRIRLIVGVLRRDVETVVHPEAVLPVRVNASPVRESAIQGATVFAGLYLAAWVVGSLFILLDCTLRGYPQDTFTAMVSAAATLGNVGPGVGASGPFGSFSGYPWESKMAMITLMWIGRLEVIPIFVLFTRAYWRR
ncbi:MAG: TrkH family potassium uptake protein [Thermoleophilia bacterium]|nr:TrkH family potassium uptake protein [Thermoleophilia bacterium]